MLDLQSSNPFAIRNSNGSAVSIFHQTVDLSSNLAWK